jgi:hypothetical protein
VLVANPQADEARRGSMEKPHAAEHAEQQGSFKRPRLAQIPIEEAVNSCLEGLRDTSGQLAAALNAGEQSFADGRIACMRRAEYRSEDARSSHSILNREIDADAADRGHGMRGVADAQQAGKTPAAQAVDLDGKQGDLIPRLDLVSAGFTAGAGYAEEGNKRGQIVPEGL